MQTRKKAKRDIDFIINQSKSWTPKGRSAPARKQTLINDIKRKMKTETSNSTQQKCQKGVEKMLLTALYQLPLQFEIIQNVTDKQKSRKFDSRVFFPTS